MVSCLYQQSISFIKKFWFTFHKHSKLHTACQFLVSLKGTILMKMVPWILTWCVTGMMSQDLWIWLKSVIH